MKSSILPKVNIKFLVKLVLVGTILYMIMLFSTVFMTAAKKWFLAFSWFVVNVTSNMLWEEPTSDELWNINVLIMGVWWKNHDWWWLTDTMMIGSFNLELKTLTFLSVPRDLYVSYPSWKKSRINGIFADYYLTKRSFPAAAKALSDKISEITSIPLNYYVVVDFEWFKQIVDSLWGIEVDVPDDIVDRSYPGPNWTYTTFKINKWIQYLNGDTALKYARSRHSTSDFSRSFRQQQVIKALLSKVFSSEIILSMNKMKTLYLKFNDTVKTNIKFKEIVSLIPKAKEIKKISSYVLHYDCYSDPNVYWKNITPGCFLVPAKRELFGGQAVLIPDNTNWVNYEDYSSIQKFAFLIINYPDFLVENSKIQILNWMDKKKIKKRFRWHLKPLASELAYTLNNHWFNVVDVRNATKILEKSTIYLYSKSPQTENLLHLFINNFEITTGNVKYSGSWFDMTVILWNDLLEN